VNGAQVVVNEFDVSASDLDRSRAVSEDALQAEDIATVDQESAGECEAEEMGRAARLDPRASRKAADELMDTTCRRARAAEAGLSLTTGRFSGARRARIQWRRPGAIEGQGADENVTSSRCREAVWPLRPGP